MPCYVRVQGICNTCEMSNYILLIPIFSYLSLFHIPISHLCFIISFDFTLWFIETHHRSRQMIKVYERIWCTISSLNLSCSFTQTKAISYLCGYKVYSSLLLLLLLFSTSSWLLYLCKKKKDMFKHCPISWSFREGCIR